VNPRVEMDPRPGCAAADRGTATRRGFTLIELMVVVALFQRHRILTQVSGDHMEVIKLIPPLMIGDTEVKLFTEAFGEVLEDASRGGGLIWEFGRTLVKQAVRG